MNFFDDDDEEDGGPGVRFRFEGGDRDGEVDCAPAELRHLVPEVITTEGGERYRVDPRPSLELVDGDHVHRAYLIRTCGICMHDYDDLNDGCTCARDGRR